MKTIQSLLQLSDQELHQHNQAIAGELDNCCYRMGEALLAAERRRLHVTHGCSSVVQYGVRALGLPAQKASELVRASRALEKLPALRAAFQTGRLGWAKIREVTRVACPDTEEEWLEFCLMHTADEVQRAITVSPRGFRKSLAAAEPTPLLHCYDQPGTRATPAPTPPDTPTPPSRPEPPPQQDPPPGRKIRLVFELTPEEFARYERAEEHIRAQARRRLPRTAVLMKLVQLGSNSVSKATRERLPIVISVDAPSGTGWYETGRGPLQATPTAVEQALQEARAIVVAPQSQPGLLPTPREKEQAEPSLLPAPKEPRQRRKISRRILRVLMARSRGRCQRCGGPGPLEVHHLTPVSEGGSDSLDNLELACSRCHGQEHAKDFARKRRWREARARGGARRTRGNRPG